MFIAQLAPLPRANRKLKIAMTENEKPRYRVLIVPVGGGKNQLINTQECRTIQKWMRSDEKDRGHNLRENQANFIVKL